MVDATPARILLIVGGGIAAYKSLDLVRRLREIGMAVRVVMTRGAQEFVTPLAFGAISGERVLTNLFDADDEHDIGHIRLSREADLIVVAPATADLMAKMANGLADDLATATLLASNRPVLIAPAMNPQMWAHPATMRNLATLRADGVAFIGPEIGEMAERGEAGRGRMAEPTAIRDAIIEALEHVQCSAAGEKSPSASDVTLAGRHVLITSGPTHEPIDPVRYIANRSSGRQGFAIAEAASAAGARVTLITGPTDLADPHGLTVQRIETAAQMLGAVEAALPADIAIFAAAVADWRVADAKGSKIKKGADGAPPTLSLVPNPDILETIAKRSAGRPRLVVGFAAETDDLVAHARTKLEAKGCDLIVANDVSVQADGSGIMGGTANEVVLISATGEERWPRLDKAEVGRRLIRHCAQAIATASGTGQ